MSLPKEPRQLMINIMYLVLTAMLALNVSAEIFNAFKVLDQGLIQSNLALDYMNEPMEQAIREAAKAKPSFQTYADRVNPIREEAQTLARYITDIKDSLITESGGYKLNAETQEFTTELKGEKNVDVTTRILVDDPRQQGLNDGKGEELKEKLLAFRTKIVEFIDDTDKTRFQEEIAVNVDDETWKEAGKASWSHMNFQNMPVQAVIPIFNKYLNDVKSTEASALNYLGKKVGIGKEDVVFGDFTVVAAPEKSYVIKGEPYKADIILTASAGPDSGTKVKFSVNDRPLRLDTEGRGQYMINTSVPGPQTYTAKATVYNPVTDKTVTYSKKFTYEVGERSVAISPTKMNVFYIGVDNPVEISVAGASSNSMKATITGAGGGMISKVADGSFIVKVKTPTRRDEYAEVKVQAEGLNVSKKFRVKRIPDPIPQLSNSKGGAMGSGEFRLQKGIFPVLKNFDFETECEILDFRIVRVPKHKDASVVRNQGGRFSAEAAALIKKANVSDKYYFEDIKCQCPGDTRPRDLGVMAFKII